MNEQSLSRQIANRRDFEHTLNLLLKNYKDQNKGTNMQVIAEAVNKNSFWLDQVKEILHVFRDDQMKYY